MGECGAGRELTDDPSRSPGRVQVSALTWRAVRSIPVAGQITSGTGRM